MKGSIRQRGSTYTVYWSTIDRATGQRLQHTKGGFKRKEAARPPQGDSAREFLNSVIGRVQAGTWRPDAQMTVRELLKDHWLPVKRSQGLAGATLAQYEKAADAWVIPHVGGVKVAALRPSDVTDLMTTLATSKTAKGKDGVSPRTVSVAVGVLKAACGWAYKAGMLGHNAIAEVEAPRRQRHEMTSWSVEDARAFLMATKEDRLAFAWALLLARGLRRGELCGLQWSDIDLEGHTLRVSRTRSVVDGVPELRVPKTLAGSRTVPLDPHLVALLRGHKRRQAEEQLRAGPAHEANGYLMADELGRPYHPDTISDWFQDRIKATGIRRIRLHDTRHTAATLMLADGVPVKVVSEMLGHASPTITLAFYAHVLPGMSERAGAALSASLLGEAQ